ncbi:MAG: serine protease [Spirosomaceae bacterium]|nr:serine protease [Spirosomataceae bacterium]
MFVEAIERVGQYTRPLHTITRTYGGFISAGSATLFFVNEFGVAVTCKHVLELILQADSINQNYQNFKTEKRNLSIGQNLSDLENRYNYRNESIIQMKNNFVNSVSSFQNLTCHAHATLDLAIIRFEGYSQKFYGSHAVFLKDSSNIKQGKSLCRLGYPFPEFSNFWHNQNTDDIEWTNTGNPNSPSFPIDGIVTRFGADAVGSKINTIEISTPGLRGQSGGPLFDTKGLVYGMQSMTSHLHLGFDIQEQEVIINGKPTKVSNHPYLHVGHCIHVDRIKEFLRENNVKFYEE